MESLGRIGSLVETARDLTLEAAQSAASVRKPTTSRPLSAQAIKKLLDSRKDAEVLEGLRNVVGLFYSNKPVIQYFTAVVKNTASSNLEIKRLVYALLIQLAENAPDTALLSVNSIQRGLSDSDPKMRALALRTMSAIRVPVISQIVALGIKRGVADMSPIVRKTAALAIIKCHRLDPTTEPLLIEQLTILIGDRQYYVVGAAIAAFLELCPERLDLIHPHYRGIVKKLVDMDEWGQLSTLKMLLMYARQCFPRPRPNKESPDNSNLNPDLEILLQVSQQLLQSRSSAVILAVARCNLYLGTAEYISAAVGPLMSILRASSDIKSLALKTIVEICGIYPTPFVEYAPEFLLSTNDSPSTIEGKLNMQSLLFPHISPAIRSLLLTDLSHCITSTSTNPTTLQLALLTLGQCAAAAPTPTLRAQCLQLLLGQLSSPDPNLVGAALDEIRLLVQRNPKLLAKTVIVRLAKHLDGLTSPKARAAIVWLVGEFVASKGTVEIAADVWRILLKDFAEEDEIVQSQILLLASKVYLHHQQNIKNSEQQSQEQTQEQSQEQTQGQNQDQTNDEDEIGKRLSEMLAQTFLLARYSTSFPLRDRARYLRALILDSPSIALGVLLLLSAKPDPGTSANIGSDKIGINNDRRLSNLTTSPRRTGRSSFSNALVGDFTSTKSRGLNSSIDALAAKGPPLGYASHILGVNVPGSPFIPAWTTVEVGSEARHATSNTSSNVSGISRETVLPKSTPIPNVPSIPSKSLEEWLDEEDVQDEEKAETSGSVDHAGDQGRLQGGPNQAQSNIVSSNQASRSLHQSRVADSESESVEETDETESSEYESTTDESTDDEESDE